MSVQNRVLRPSMCAVWVIMVILPCDKASRRPESRVSWADRAFYSDLD